MQHRQLITTLAGAAALLASIAAPAGVVTDSFTLSTQDQSIWANGPAGGWSFSSGFQGATWGTYANKAPVSFGLDAMTGSQRTLTPGTGITVPDPAYPVLLAKWEACKLFSSDCGSEPSKTITIPPVYVDTRLGVDLGVKSSGKIGIDVQAKAGGGAIDMTLPFTVQLNLPDQINAGQLFAIGGKATLGSGATMSVAAPFFSASIDASVHQHSQLGITACALLGSCVSASSSPAIDTDFNVLDFDTRNPKPLKLLGLPVNNVVLNTPGPLLVGLSSVGDQTLFAPQDRSGGTVNGNLLSLNTSSKAAQFNLDLAGIVADAVLHVPLDATLQLGVGTVSATALSAKVGVNLGLNESLRFNAGIDARLDFDEVLCSFDLVQQSLGSCGKSMLVDLDSSDPIMYFFPGAAGHLVGRSYSIDDDSVLSNDTKLSIDPREQVKAGCYELEAQGFTTQSYCALDQTQQTTNLLQLRAYFSEFALGGFNTARFSDRVDGNPNDPPPSVPEPGVPALLALAAAAAVWSSRARRR